MVNRSEAIYSGIKRALKQVDIFGRPVPTFNLYGKEKIKTISGGVVSLLIPIIVLFFACFKFIHLIHRLNPNVSQVIQRNFYSDSDIFDTKEEKWRIAFALEDYLTKEMKTDEKYIKMFVRLTG